MWEPRVVRGNTYSLYSLAKEEANGQPRQPLNRQARQSGPIHETQFQHNLTAGSGDPGQLGEERPAPAGKAHAKVFTEEHYLYETDLPACYEAATQTEFVLEREKPDLSIPEPQGVHKETQIYPDEPPFDFNYEAEPLLQVLLTRLLEESRVEVLEEEELRAMKVRQEMILAHKAEVKRKLVALEDK